MKAIVCIDKNNGLMFGGRRQSTDRVLRAKVTQLIGSNKLLLNRYSAEQFEAGNLLCVSDNFLKTATVNDFCFIENVEIPIENIDEFYIFNWNRNYPADKFFNTALLQSFTKISTEHFKGYSHDKITLTIYKRK